MSYENSGNGPEGWYNGQQDPANGWQPAPGPAGNGWQQPAPGPVPGPFGALPAAPTPGPFDGAAEPAGPPRRPRTKLAVATGIGVVGIIGLATVLVMSQTGNAASGGKNNSAAGAHSTSASPTPSGFQPTATTPAAAAAETAQVFLSAWESGNFKQAASYTDNPAEAQTVLTAYGTGLNLNGLKLTPQGSTAAGVVTFSVAANTNTGGASSNKATYASGTWTYTSKLTAYKKGGGWWIKWDPSSVAPNMTSSTHPVALVVKPGAAKVTDASGNDLSSSSQSALQDVGSIMKQNTKSTQGTAGLEVVLEDSSGKVVDGSKQVLSTAVSTATVKTTIDPTMEALATSAVGQLPRSGLVVLRPSTGAILAVANSSGSSDLALTGTLAPGSSFKVVSTTALLADGMLPQGINSQVGCPLVEDVQGVKIHNSTSSANSSAGTEDFEPNNTPFSTDFAQSCNNAFTQWWQQMAGGKLAGAASTYYGLNESWDIGLGSQGSYFSMPSHQSGSELAEELYGQGQIQANPLTMASVAATVDTGTFHQPYLVSGLTDMASATALPSSVKSQLWTVMHEVITSGTADAVGFGSGVYGKTGTAEADANKDHYPNGWMIVFDPNKDLAIAAVVVDSNFGAKTAGPEVNYVLQHS
ncbi:penicillin-binding transpeptidase domain-containing protein [Actinospica sp.]|uniref:penicillin-binding transpeptidase domain-containing protein n=1 Tax=Actinospica sp. TaxID=1872142 RepID=UPI002C268DED|nr:penicillin-binding transpeptidase domain-containing protein [Actinospica sp.]HWG22983.1 penicillin-binding transpeptidase domain-containing protein [Actinospica sp.]